MRIKILGSGGLLGVPVWSCDCKVCKNPDPKDIRTRVCLLVQSKGKNILVDTGPDFREQMLREGIKKLDHVFITHSHIDHTACLRELQAAGNVKLEIPEKVLNELKKTRNVLEHVQKRNPEIQISVFKPQKIGSVFVDSIEVRHDKDILTMRTPTFGYLFEENGKRVAYISDFNKIVEIDKMKNLDVFICDGGVMESKWGHIGVKDAIELYKKIKPKLMILTHLTHRRSHKELSEYVSKHGNIKVAYDGMEIEL